MVWNSHLLKNFPQFVVINTAKGFGIVNKAEYHTRDNIQENNTRQEKTYKLYTWISPSDQYQNQIDCILCSQIWGSFIHSAKTRSGAGFGSDYELLIVKFRKPLDHPGMT